MKLLDEFELHQFLFKHCETLRDKKILYDPGSSQPKHL